MSDLLVTHQPCVCVSAGDQVHSSYVASAEVATRSHTGSQSLVIADGQAAGGMRDIHTCSEANNGDNTILCALYTPPCYAESKHMDPGAVCRQLLCCFWHTAYTCWRRTDGSRLAGGERERARALLPSTFEGGAFYSNSHGIAMYSTST